MTFIHVEWKCRLELNYCMEAQLEWNWSVEWNFRMEWNVFRVELNGPYGPP